MSHDCIARLLELLDRIEKDVIGEDRVTEDNVHKYARYKYESGLINIYQDSLRRHQRRILDTIRAEITHG